MNHLLLLVMLFITGTSTRGISQLAQQPAPFFNALDFGCDYKKVTVIDAFDTPHHTKIAILQDKQGTKFIVKQDLRFTPLPHLSTVRDNFGAFLAASADVPANRVLIIPAGFAFPGKDFIDLPATLHSFVPGKSAQDIRKKSDLLSGSIRQWMKESMSTTERGLTKLVLDTMSKHDDLCKIVALDTFIANVDRNTKNYFYDAKTNSFFAIDLEGSLYGDLAIYACNFISAITQDPDYKLSSKNRHALTVYRNTLDTLVRLYSPHSLYKKLLRDTYAAGMITTHQKSNIISAQLQKYKERIAINYTSCKRLVSLLDTLLAHHKKKHKTKMYH